MRIGVVICTHAPRKDYLGRTIEALRAQTLSPSEWDLVVVDNASPEPVDSWLDLGWHPRASIVKESSPGIVYARTRGLASCSQSVDWIVWVDDDNVLRADFLEQLRRLVGQHPELGALGGSLKPEFEVEPEAWTRRWWEYLALSGVDEPCWASGPTDLARIPPGAGLCIRREVVEAWVNHLRRDRRFQMLGVRGGATFRGDDTDLVWECFSRGWKVGRFPELCLSHLMPPRRFTEEALVDLYLKTILSTELLVALRTGERWKKTGLFGLLQQGLASLRLPRRARRFALAEVLGVLRARWTLARLRQRSAGSA